MTKYLFTFILIAQVILSPAQAAGPMCLSYFKTESQLSSVRERFAAAFKDPEGYVKTLAVTASSLSFKAYVGHGTSATVVLVQSGKKTYALKLTNTPEELIPSSYRPMIINKILGDLGLAPKVMGILNPSETKKWIKANEKALKKINPKDELKRDYYSRATTGLLMEVVKSTLPKYDSYDAEIGLKEYALRGDPLLLEREFHAELVVQAQRIDNILAELNIMPNDPDLILTKSDKLILIDTGMYYANPAGTGNNSHEIEKFINRATRSEK